MPRVRRRHPVERRAAQHAARIEDGVPLALREAASWGWRLIVVVLAGWLALKGLGRIREVVVPVVIAILLASLLQPVTNVLRRRGRLGPLAASAITLLGLLGLLGAVVTLAGQQLTASLGDIQQKAAKGLGQVTVWLNNRLGIDSVTLNKAVQEVSKRAQSNSDTLVNGALTGLASATTIVTGIFITLFTLFFVLAHGDRLWMWIVSMLPEPARDRTHEAFRRGWRSLGFYVRTQVLVAAVDATGIAAGVAVLGLLSYAAPVWLLVFLFSFIPIVGAFLSGAIAVFLVLVLKSFWAAVIMLVVVVVVQQVESHGMQPFLMGRAVSLHPLAVFLGVAIGGTVAGIPGALFAIPLMAFVNATTLYLAGRDPAPHLNTDDRTHRVLLRYASQARLRASRLRPREPR